VKAGEVLAVIDVPEVVKQREAKLADIGRLEAEGRRAAADSSVAKARVEAYAAKVEGAKADLASADADLTAAGVELERAGDLVNRGAVADRFLDEATKKHEAAEARKTALLSAVDTARAEQQLAEAQSDAAEANVEVCQAAVDVGQRELEELEERLGFAQIKAPFDGVVSERHVEPGDLVRSDRSGGSDAGRPLFVITKIDRLRIRVPVPERDAPLAGVGDEARVTMQALGSRVFDGKIDRVAGVLDERTRTMLVEIDLDNAEGNLLPGMFGQANITLETAADRVVLPADVVRYDEAGQAYVYVVNSSSQIEIVQVSTGWDTGQQIEILSGLTGGERVVGPILGRLRAGQMVRVE
jgi:RND family efflux transporter MFP subunit